MLHVVMGYHKPGHWTSDWTVDWTSVSDLDSC